MGAREGYNSEENVYYTRFNRSTIMWGVRYDGMSRGFRECPSSFLPIGFCAASQHISMTLRQVLLRTVGDSLNGDQDSRSPVTDMRCGRHRTESREAGELDGGIVRSNAVHRRGSPRIEYKSRTLESHSISSGI